MLVDNLMITSDSQQFTFSKNVCQLLWVVRVSNTQGQSLLKQNIISTHVGVSTLFNTFKHEHLQIVSCLVWEALEKSSSRNSNGCFGFPHGAKTPRTPETRNSKEVKYESHAASQSYVCFIFPIPLQRHIEVRSKKALLAVLPIVTWHTVMAHWRQPIGTLQGTMAWGVPSLAGVPTEERRL